jgi:hypothetical protein
VSDDGVSDDKDGDEEAANDQRIWSERDEVEQSGVIYLFALVPSVLILTLLSLLAGDVVWKVGPPLMIAAFLGYRVWIAYRYRLEEPGEWQALGSGLFPGEEPRKQVRNLALVLFALLAIYVFAPLMIGPWLGEKLDNLRAWTVPWPLDWF